MNNLVEACIAGNAKNMRNRSTLPRNFSATARTKKSRLVPKLVLRHALSGNIHLVAFWGVTTNHGPKFFDLSLLDFANQNLTLNFWTSTTNKFHLYAYADLIQS
jgi:hypothetical protein